VEQLSRRQYALVETLAKRLGAILGVRAVVLGGSHARGRAHAGSDIDLGVLYAEAAPFAIESVRALSEELNDVPGPVVSGFYEWGPWVNGGAWLTIGGQRVDFLYRSLEHLARVADDAAAGRYEIHYGQQPPFGFFSGTILGELAICQPVFDPEGLVARLKLRVASYPDALRRAVVQGQLWAAEFGLNAFAPKFAARGDTFGTAGCLTRAVNQLVLALFALNRRHLLNDKTALVEIAEFERAPRDFGPRVQETLARLGSSPDELAGAVDAIERLLRETIGLSEGLYHARYPLPG
jgi:predicted nucleotidyltransferase